MFLWKPPENGIKSEKVSNLGNTFSTPKTLDLRMAGEEKFTPYTQCTAKSATRNGMARDYTEILWR
jgi:hypothetical protein